jgi:DNA topoisomerase VI subunit B
MDKLVVKNSDSGQEIALKLVAISTGQGPSPSNSEKITMEVQHKTYVYVNEQTDMIEMLKYSKDLDGAMVQILHNVEIVRPSTDGMTPMDNETLESAITLTYMLESIF